MRRPQAIFLLNASSLSLIYGPDEIRDLSRRVEFVAPPQTRESIAADPTVLKNVEVIFGGWGMPLFDADLLQHAPNLRAVFYGAGACGYWLTQHVWDRNISVTSATTANSIPVAEYTLAMILLSLKHTFTLNRQLLAQRSFIVRDGAPGAYRSTVGLISLGATARALIGLLRPFDLQLIAYDPFVTAKDASALGVELVPLKEVFTRSHVVSLHTPLLDETIGMITGEHLRSMPVGSTFINTARGPIVRENEMIDVLSARTDLQAILDVTCDEPPTAHSPLYALPNVFLTPHIAGSVGRECNRMGRYMVEELDRYLAGQPLKWSIRSDVAANTAHRPVLKVFAKSTPHAAPVHSK